MFRIIMKYMYIIPVRVEGLVIPNVVPKMAGLSDELVSQRIIVYKAMGGLACGEVVLGRGWVADEGVSEFRPTRHTIEELLCSSLPVEGKMPRRG